MTSHALFWNKSLSKHPEDLFKAAYPNFTRSLVQLDKYLSYYGELLDLEQRMVTFNWVSITASAEKLEIVRILTKQLQKERLQPYKLLDVWGEVTFREEGKVIIVTRQPEHTSGPCWILCEVNMHTQLFEDFVYSGVTLVKLATEIFATKRKLEIILSGPLSTLEFILQNS